MDENKVDNQTPANAPNAQAGGTPDPAQAQNKEQQAQGTDVLLNEGKPKDGGGVTPDPWDSDDWNKLVPDKFKLEDGKINDKALAKSYLHLEKRFGSGDVPPDKPEDYKIDVQFPEGSIDPERDKGFRKACHGAGMTNKQVHFVYERLNDLITEGMAVDGKNKEAARNSLKESWGDNYGTNVKDAYKAFNAFADDQDRAAIKEIGNNPMLLRLLAKIGREMKEDTPPNFAEGQSEDDVKVLMKSEAYWDPKHPEHDVVTKKVAEFYKRNPKRGKA